LKKASYSATSSMIFLYDKLPDKFTQSNKCVLKQVEILYFYVIIWSISVCIGDFTKFYFLE